MFASSRLATLACLGAFAVLSGDSRAAWAALPGNATVTFRRLLIHEDLDSSELVEPSTDDQRRTAFNNARCKCSQAGAANSDFSYELGLDNRTTAVNRPGELWTGPGCDTETTANRPLVCRKVAELGDLDVLSTTPAKPLIPVFALVQPTGTACEARETGARLWLGADGDADGSLEYWNSAEIAVDTQPPPVPTEIVATSGESAVNLKWTLPTERISDVRYIQVLCAKADGTPALSKPSNDARFETGKALCNIDDGIPMVASDGTTEVPAWVRSADESYVCASESAVTQVRIGGLANGVPYQVAVIAVDLAGNASGVYVTTPVTPAPVTDFWEDLHDKGSTVEGGFCLLARTYGDDSELNQALRAFRDDTLARSAWGRAMIDGYYRASAALAPWVSGAPARVVAMVALAPLVLVALAWHVLGLPLCALLVLGAPLLRRSARRRGAARRAAAPRVRPPAAALAASAACGVALVLLGWPRAGHAQTSLEPYWDDEQANDDEYQRSRWHAGIRIGPYVPAIDAQFGGAEPGPYEQMFGDSSAILPMLDVDRVLWEGIGQFAVGGSIGYMSKTARAYATGGAAGERASDKNSFRMIPLAATAAFRLTMLDTRYRVPVIPYLRGGLAYHLWWIEAPDGGVASVCRPGGATCNENKARGGSLGVVASLGLAVRAEQIDFEAASAMRESGIQHAGFYAEVQASKVDDFGIGNKLAVGDVTWFAGVDFEF
jgi:hypothetical protein